TRRIIGSLRRADAGIQKAAQRKHLIQPLGAVVAHLFSMIVDVGGKWSWDSSKGLDARNEMVIDHLVSRIKALGAIPTPFSTYVYYHGEKMRYYGAERLNQMFALRSFLDAGVRTTQASDYPSGEFIPMMALQSEVTRTDTKGNIWGPKQKIT